MLAEPRRRERYSINPRGLSWSNDDNKFGQRLLEKMGWKKGKALGLNEDGCKEHVKVQAKSDRKGVGCTRQHANNWIAHQEDFNSILSALNKDVDKSSSGATFSLHDKSKNSRSRVHYKKFTKGKDLSGYRTADLNCIFGERQRKNTETEKKSKVESGAADTEENRSFGVLTVTSSASIDSYFASKLASQRSGERKTGPHSETASHEPDSIIQQDVTCTADSDETSDVKMVKRHKKKKAEREDEKDADCRNSNHVVPLKTSESGDKSTKKKKKKSDHLEAVDDDVTHESSDVHCKKNKKRTRSISAVTEVDLAEQSAVRSKKKRS